MNAPWEHPLADVEAMRVWIREKCRGTAADVAVPVPVGILRGLLDEIDAAPVAEVSCFLCFLCINDARTAEALGNEPLPILPATTITNGMSICDAEGRHRIEVRTNSGLIVPQGQMPPLNGHGG